MSRSSSFPWWIGLFGLVACAVALNPWDQGTFAADPAAREGMIDDSHGAVAAASLDAPPTAIGSHAVSRLQQIAQAGPPPGRGRGQGRGAGAGPGGGPGFGQGRGAGGAGLDDQFAVDRDVFHFLLDNHAKISRQVEQLPNGVRTRTESDDAEIAAMIKKHVKAMYARVDEGRPIRLRDPLFVAVFQHADQIEMNVNVTEKGVQVTETSQNPYVARLIQAHAKVVAGFVEHGFEEAHRMHPVPDQGAADVTSADDDSSAVSIRRKFAEFDRAYIPALALTNQLKQQPAEKAMQRLRTAWTSFVEAIEEHVQADEQWGEDQEAIRDTIGAAARKLQAEQPAEAHEILEEIRGRLSAMRQRNRIPYDLDALNEFHETMELIVKPAMKSTADDVDEAAKNDLQKLLRTAGQQWAVVETEGFDAAAWNLDEAAQQKLRGMVQQERQALDKLESALKAAEPEPILEAAAGLKPPYAKLYMSFGEFPN